MKIFLSLLMLIGTCILIGSTTASAQNSEINIVPRPKSVTPLNEKFELNYKTKIIAYDEGGRQLAGYLNDWLLKNYGFKLEYAEKPAKEPKNAIIFTRPTDMNSLLKDESYGLYVVKNGARIVSRSDTGLFYGLQSFIQLVPVKIEKGKTKIPGVDIVDEPRFQYRGMHLDTSRHFMPLDFVKKYIDLMSQYKLNKFHWHLTDDQGWRIEIKKYPKLTEIGSKRAESHEGRYSTTFKGDGIPIEGFYTQEQIKDVVAYAKARKITVIPEIELPGHASAALAAYPELGKGCKENYDYKVQKTWGIFKEVFCPTETTFKFLEDVLEETIALFPDSPYIHIGGDEVLKDHWKESPYVQDLMKRENLKDEHEVQSYFIRRMEKFINSKGKRIIGWDEILEGGLAPNATVMSWRGTKGGIEAAKANHDVIMTPTDYCYFDYSQGDPQNEPLNIGGFVPLEKVYSYDPLPAELNQDQKKYILGVQANIWTEYLKKPESVEYMAFPRMLALAEIAWTPLEAKNFADFKSRAYSNFDKLDKQKVNYRIPAPEGLNNYVLTQGDTYKIALKAYSPDAKIHYTTDKSDPTESSPVYRSPIDVTFAPGQVYREVKAIVITPAGRKSIIYKAVILKREVVTAVELTEKRAGVDYWLFRGNFSDVTQFNKNQPPPETGETKTLGLNQFKEKLGDMKQPFALIYEGFLNVPADAIYEFNVECDDSAVVYIGGNDEALVGVDPTQPDIGNQGVIPLQKGFHKIRVKYIQRGGDANLRIRWGVKGNGLEWLNAGALVH